jgi:hypothetical protein
VEDHRQLHPLRHRRQQRELPDIEI